MLALLLLGCTAAISVYSAPPGAAVYVTDYVPPATQAPVQFEAAGTTPMVCEVEYFAWENYYVWAQVQGQAPLVVPIDNEIKPVPGVVGVCCFLPALIWAYGPSEAPVQLRFESED